MNTETTETLKSPTEMEALLIENRQRFEVLYETVKKLHNDAVGATGIAGGHGFDHDLMVAQYGIYIAPDAHTGTLAWVAGMLHSTDRIVAAHELEPRLQQLLSLLPGDISGRDRELILDAVLKHSRKNEVDDTIITIALKDADRLANTNPGVLMRAGQFCNALPFVIPTIARSPGVDIPNTYNDPRSAYDSLAFNIEWETWFRLPKAQQLGQEHCAYLRQYMLDVRQSYAAMGVGVMT